VPLVLALEPDPRQAAALKPILERRVGAELVMADSKDSAIAVLADRVPDLILVTALLSPRDEAELNDHLRTLEGAEHVQTLTIPMLGTAAKKPARRKRGLLGALRSSGPDKGVSDGCDPAEFADQIRAYIERAQELKAEAAAAAHRASLPRRPAKAPEPAAGSAAPADATRSPDSGASSSYWSWDAPSAPATAAFQPAVSADALAEFEGAGGSAQPWDDPDTLPLKLDQHESGVVDAADVLLQQPGAEEAPSPSEALVRLDAVHEQDAAEGDGGHELTIDEQTTRPGEAVAEPDDASRWLLRADIAVAHPEIAPVERIPAIAGPAAAAVERYDAFEPAGDESNREAQERLQRETEERERLEAEAAGRERAAREEAERARVEAAEREQLAREAEEREQAALEQVAREQAERERIARETEEQERVAREDAEQARAEAAERERQARSKKERERLARQAEERERLEQERAEREAQERERLARDVERRERIARLVAERERAERDRLAREAEERLRLAQEAEERERLAREEVARERAELERLAREAAERERLAREEAARERAEHERLAKEAEQRERLAREEAARERAERERLAKEAEGRERLAREEAARERAERERLAKEAEERERLAREEAARERAERERLARDAEERERLAREEAARERAERERLAKEAEERERLAREEAARERAERERLAREVEERERLVRLEAEERERLAQEQALQEKYERERLAREAEERERAARAEAARERVERERLAREAEELARTTREQADRDLAQLDQATHVLTTRVAQERAAREAAERERQQQIEEHARREAAAEEDRERLLRELAAQREALAEAIRTAELLKVATTQAQQQAAESAEGKRPRLKRPRPVKLPRKGAKGKTPAAGQQDEWGLYDPAACGFEALYAKLQEQERGTETPPDEPTASDLLMKAGRNGTKTNGTPAAARRRAPAPLAIWARQETSSPAPAPPLEANGVNGTGVQAPREVHAILKALKLPPHVAEISYADGCRIRRVRIRARQRGKRGKGTVAGPLIVLSRRKLAELRGALGPS